jgi:hypothetical protein
LIGPTMVSGRCFIPKYPNIHEDSTMKDLMITNLCTSHPTTGTSNIVPLNTAGVKADMRINGRNIKLEKN